ncbi:NHL repeat [Carpediemonas membranifera]|uniref:NHL repeat n=1 Tax=Carpediemonas membranifera TaxID=201153 RepID=A0A8J6DZ50_9EUKA|nr:NHL repeat [Carpediemonas membranifera]|eukprot:KAG9390248.1 NHL repeat [Carpediemonas membranifera]
MRRKAEEKRDYLSDHFQSYEAYTFVGTPRSGMVDGPRIRAQFNHPNCLAMLADGSIVVSDTDNSLIRVVSPTGDDVVTVRWNGGRSLLNPRGIAVIGDGLLVADEGHNRIRHISADGSKLTTFAGSGRKGRRDGPLLQAQFNSPTGLYVTGDGTVLVCDTGNHRIRAVHPDTGTVTTIAGSTAGFLDSETATQAQFNSPTDLCVLNDGTIVISDRDNHAIRRIEPHSFAVSTVVGSGSPGFTDGPLTHAMLASPYGLAVFDDSTVLFTEYDNNCVRRLDLRAGVVTTIAGRRQWGYADGAVTEALFNYPRAILVDGQDVYIADSGNHCIRKLIPAVAYAEPQNMPQPEPVDKPMPRPAAIPVSRELPARVQHTAQPARSQRLPDRPPRTQSARQPRRREAFEEPVRDLPVPRSTDIAGWESLDSPLNNVVRPRSRMSDASARTRPTSRQRPVAPEPYTPADSRTESPLDDDGASRQSGSRVLGRQSTIATAGTTSAGTLSSASMDRDIVWAVTGSRPSGEPVLLQLLTSNDLGTFVVRASSAGSVFECDIMDSEVGRVDDQTVTVSDGGATVTVTFAKPRDCDLTLTVLGNFKREQSAVVAQQHDDLPRDVIDSETDSISESTPESAAESKPYSLSHMGREEDEEEDQARPLPISTAWSEGYQRIVGTIQSSVQPENEADWLGALGEEIDARDKRIRELEAELAERQAVDLVALEERVVEAVRAVFKGMHV